METKMNMYGLLVLIAAVVALVAVFLAWTSGGGFSITGWQYYNEWHALADIWEIYIPLIVLILAIVAIVFALLEFVGVSFNAMMQKVIVMVIGVLILLFVIIFANKMEFKYMGIGIYLDLIAGILLIVVPLLALLKVLPEAK
ncbi:MAG: hypothetical protein LBI08_01980 [Methanomassiliicoccaceae archaeon]|jgi:hypothetical protein|nr:hypothetical protein [Methanomassiliicoccaceae archaeon]